MTPLRVAVGSDQTLVAEAVAAALRSRSLDALVVRWPLVAVDPVPKVRRSRSSRRAVGPPPDTGLVVSDLSRMEQLRGARILVTGLPVPWLVMAGIARGPAWGALYESGVAIIVPNDTGLDKACRLLEDLASGRLLPRGRRGQRELVRAWHAFAARRSELERRLRTLTERETDVLQRLHDGVSVRAIAEESEVTEATVRSQVKSILRKLDVNSQVAAVAAYEDVIRDSTG